MPLNRGKQEGGKADEDKGVKVHITNITAILSSAQLERSEAPHDEHVRMSNM